MHKVAASLSWMAGVALLAAASGTPPADAQAAFGRTVNTPTPALAAFDRTLRTVRDYTTNDVVAEQLNDGSRVETRTYAYAFAKPASASATIVSGPGTGIAAAWHGGDTVRYRRPGALSGIKLTIAIDDPRVQTLRGDTIDMATFAYELQYMLATPGTLTEAAGPVVGATATTAVTLKVKDPAVAAVTKVVLLLGTTSHLPVRRQQFVGSTVVKTETFEGTKTNVGVRADLDV